MTADNPAGASEIAEALRTRPVVLFGAGHLGKRILTALRGAGIEPCAFADNNPALHGRAIEGIQAFSPGEAARRFGRSALFVIAVWRPAHSGGLSDIRRQLRAFGCDAVIPFPQIIWLFPELLPHYLWDLPSKMEGEKPAIEDALSLFDDEPSRAEFRAQVEFRTTGDPDRLPAIQAHAQYFPEFIRPDPDECLVDCGAYDGDSIRAFLDWNGGRFRKILAFEADPACAEKLRRFAVTRPEIAGRLTCEPLAVSRISGTVRFNANGTAAASISSQGGLEVRSIAIDDLPALDCPTFIKMDIEGAEPDALCGARETIRTLQPVLAVCVYHAQNHLWRLPLLMRQLFPEARLFLRSYCLDGLDTVCYAVPEHRLQLSSLPPLLDSRR